MAKHPLEIGFSTKTLTKKGVIELILWKPEIRMDTEGNAYRADRELSIEDFVYVLNHLPPEVCEKITGSLYKGKKYEEDIVDA